MRKFYASKWSFYLHDVSAWIPKHSWSWELLNLAGLSCSDKFKTPNKPISCYSDSLFVLFRPRGSLQGHSSSEQPSLHLCQFGIVIITIMANVTLYCNWDFIIMCIPWLWSHSSSICLLLWLASCSCYCKSLHQDLNPVRWYELLEKSAADFSSPQWLHFLVVTVTCEYSIISISRALCKVNTASSGTLC